MSAHSLSSKLRNRRFVGSRDLLREAVQSKTERGEQLNALMKEGKLVPMVGETFVSSPDCKETFAWLFRKWFSTYSRRTWSRMSTNRKDFWSMVIHERFLKRRNSKKWSVIDCLSLIARWANLCACVRRLLLAISFSTSRPPTIRWPNDCYIVVKHQVVSMTTKQQSRTAWQRFITKRCLSWTYTKTKANWLR